PEKTAKVKLIWTPAHSSFHSNEEAHDAARGLTCRAGATSDPSIESLTGGVRLVTFRDILNYYAGERMRYSPAHPSLEKRQAVAPAQLSRWYSDRYKGDCQLCGARATLRHIVWEFSRLDRKAQPLLKKIPNQESWEALLLCTDLKVLEQVVRLAVDAAGVHGILARSCSRCSSPASQGYSLAACTAFAAILCKGDNPSYNAQVQLQKNAYKITAAGLCRLRRHVDNTHQRGHRRAAEHPATRTPTDQEKKTKRGEEVAGVERKLALGTSRVRSAPPPPVSIWMNFVPARVRVTTTA
ncbi:hypothetical protein HPB47_008204, partial [Ixodes persulcatus]